MAQARDTAYFIAAIRQLSNMEDDPAVTDEEVRNRASEAKSGLYDLILSVYEHYAVKSVDFSLAGNVGGNTYDLPTDFYKDVSLDLNPSNPVAVHRMGSWVDRYQQRRRAYTLIGSELVVEPATVAQGSYRLRYTPLDKPFQVPTVVTVAYTPTPIDATGGAADGTLRNFFFPLAVFDASYVLGLLYIAGSVSNDGYRLISSVEDATDIRTSALSPVVSSEVFGPGVTAAAYLQPLDLIAPGGGGSSITMYEADFSLAEVGTVITIAGSAQSDGDYTVTAILDEHTVQVAEIAPGDEYLAPGVTATFQEAGTVNDLPQIMAPWYEYIQVAGAIAVKSKIEQETGDLEMRLQRLTARIVAMAANRMEEGGQIALPSRTGGFWNDDGGFGD